MKAKELMLGDWVSWTHSSKTRYSRVSSIHKNAIFLDACPQRFMLHEIEPIPLTVEMLLNNGFVFDEYWDEYILHLDKKNIFKYIMCY